MPNFVEHEGEIIPSYTGRNAPNYPGAHGDHEIPHEAPFLVRNSDSVRNVGPEEVAEGAMVDPSPVVPARLDADTVARGKRGTETANVDLSKIGTNAILKEKAAKRAEQLKNADNN